MSARVQQLAVASASHDRAHVEVLEIDAAGAVLLLQDGATIRTMHVSWCEAMALRDALVAFYAVEKKG